MIQVCLFILPAHSPSSNESSRFRNGGRTEDDWTVMMDGIMSDPLSFAKSP